MKKILTSIVAATLLAGLVAAQPQRRYTVIDLGTLGGAYSNGFGINIEGDVVGAAATPAQTDGFAATASLWSKRKLSGAIFPVSGLPTWLTVLNRLDPMTYAVDPMRRIVFAHLHISAVARRVLDPGVTWWGWHVPTLVE